jgi:hypothetical protein
MKYYHILLSIVWLLVHNAAHSSSVFDFLSNSNASPTESNPQEDIQNFFDDHKLETDSSDFVNLGEAKMVAINKITASSQVLNVKVNKPIFFHNLEIHLHKCVKVNNLYKPDSYGLVTLTEYKVNDDAKLIFQGWLIASSISLSNFEHPIYEIFMQECN